MKEGDTFYFRSGDIHWWMVLSDPQQNSQEVLLVNMTSYDARKEQTCLLNPGDHSEVKHNSCIPFHRAEVYTDAHLNHLEMTSKIYLKDPLSPDLLKRIREAAVNSKFLPLDKGQLLIDQGLVDP